MKKLALLFPAVCAILLLAADSSQVFPMPFAVTGNSVSVLKNGTELYSVMGVGIKKTWDDVSNRIYVLHFKSGKWVEGRAVPGVAGRIGSSPIGTRGQVFVFGGYVVDGEGNELTIGDANSYLHQERRWYRATDIPVPVDSAVIGVTHDRFIYLIGGRSKNGPVNNVQ